MDRRNFIASAGMLAAAGAAAPMLQGCSEADPMLRGAKVDVKESYKCQLLVVGGGPAGVCAAVSAARRGIKTMLVDSGNCLGGMGTKGLVGPFMTCYDAKGERMIIRGLFEEIVDRLIAVGGAIHPSKIRQGTEYTAWISEGHDHVTPFDPELLKVVYDHLCKEAGVKVLYNSMFLKPIMKGSNIAGAVFLTPSGLEAAAADMVIDATGDGTVAFRAGAPCVFGDPENNRVQPASLFFRMNNIDTPRLIAEVVPHLPEFRRVNGVSYRCLHWRVAEAEAAGEWDLARKSVNIWRSVEEDQWVVNCTRIHGVDPTDAENLSAAEEEGRRQVQELMHFFRKYVPGCEKATLMGTGSVMGIRESRHVHGDFVLPVQDLIDGLIPEDTILLSANSIDVHGAMGGPAGGLYMPIKKDMYGIPYRVLLPKGVGNLLLAGRCVSADSAAAGAIRVMPPAMALGQAAGTAAALSLLRGTTPQNLDFGDLRAALVADKAYLGE
ncbi:MAG: FAD-dependent oxidoreductase [Bacteroidales bacterium]|nr:FAD-dependent oxidoreductase [Bacteroidales bacterium]